jgi:phospholipase C
MMKRRDALKTLGGLGAAAGIARFLPGCGGGEHRGADAGVDTKGPPGITTYVYMMMENRSYDHMFGARSMLEGKPGDGLRPTMTNPNLAGAPIAPWAPTKLQMCDPDPPHGWDAAHASWNNGANDGFVVQHQIAHDRNQALIEPMQYLTRNEAPVSWALADAYGTADRWFCSVMGPTFPNRFYWHTGTSGGINSNILPGRGGLPWPSIHNRLSDKGIPWAYYYGSISALSAFANFDITGNIHPFTDFTTDAMDGKLPPVVYIDPFFNFNDDHPPTHPINGQALIATVYNALASSPHWENCLLVITYDENGGFFDHVSPPTTVDDHASTGFDRMGFRVPALVAGPYVKEGHVSSVVYDHCSALHELELAFELPSLTQRTAAAHDLGDFIDMDRLANGAFRTPITLPALDLDQWPQGDECRGGTLRTASHPVIDWADANPDLVAGLDLRPRFAEYERTIRDFLANYATVGAK